MENKPVKVLYFVDRMLRGGIQTFVYENQKHMNPEKVHIDYLLLDDGNHYEMEEDLKKLGSTLYILEGIWPTSPFYIFKYCKALDNFFKEHHDYKAVHLHSSSKNFWVLKYAKKYGIPVRIAHSHSIDFMTNNQMKKVVGNVFKLFLKKYATDYFACSQKAGEWLFGKGILKNEKFKVIHNGVDLDKFQFDVEKRKAIRKELNIQDDEIIIGNVGRFSPMKNQEFLVEILKDLNVKDEKYKLLFIGTGECENNIINLVKQYNLTNNVIFAGFRQDANEYLNAMDIFAFPSKFEGLGLVLIEAQANGLYCIASEYIPQEAKVSSLLRFLSLNNENDWVKDIEHCNYEHKDVSNEIMEKEYSIRQTAKLLENFYMIGV